MNKAIDTRIETTGAKSAVTPELAAFIATTSPRKSSSILDPYWAEIAKLSNDGYSLAKIREFLKTVGVTISRPGLHLYIRKNLK
jgi:hypothetical protein